MKANKSKRYFFRLLDVTLSGFNSLEIKMTNPIIRTIEIPDIVFRLFNKTLFPHKV